MQFTSEQIAEFIAIWEREFGEVISEDRAKLEAGLVMELYWAVLKPQSPEVRYNDGLP